MPLLLPTSATTTGSQFSLSSYIDPSKLAAKKADIQSKPDNLSLKDKDGGKGKDGKNSSSKAGDSSDKSKASSTAISAKDDPKKRKSLGNKYNNAKQDNNLFLIHVQVTVVCQDTQRVRKWWQGIVPSQWQHQSNQKDHSVGGKGGGKDSSSATSKGKDSTKGSNSKSGVNSGTKRRISDTSEAGSTSTEASDDTLSDLRKSKRVQGQSTTADKGKKVVAAKKTIKGKEGKKVTESTKVNGGTKKSVKNPRTGKGIDSDESENSDDSDDDEG